MVSLFNCPRCQRMLADDWGCQRCRVTWPNIKGVIQLYRPTDNRTYEAKRAVQDQYYTSTADRYDEWNVLPPSNQIVDEHNQIYLRQVLVGKKSETALDLGSGTGRITAWLLEHARRVIGIDQSQALLERASQKHPMIWFVRSEATQLPFGNQSIDLVLVNGSLHHFFALEAVLRESYRVLEPGGKLIILGEPNQRFESWLNPFFLLFILWRVVIKILHVVGVEVEKFHGEEIEPEAESYDPKEFRLTLVRLGFIVERFETYDFLPRLPFRWWLRFYRLALRLEPRLTRYVFSNRGRAIRCVARKNVPETL